MHGTQDKPIESENKDKNILTKNTTNRLPTAKFAQRGQGAVQHS